MKRFKNYLWALLISAGLGLALVSAALDQGGQDALFEYRRVTITYSLGLSDDRHQFIG